MVIQRLPPRPEGFDPRPTGALSMVLVLVVVVGVWFLNGRDPGTGTDPGSTSTSTTDVARLDPDSGLPYVDLADLPVEAATTVRLVDEGGPFPAAQDGATFEDTRGVLPEREPGYYAAYTVATPGSGEPGARRVVAGDGGELYWSADRASYARIRR